MNLLLFSEPFTIAKTATVPTLPDDCVPFFFSSTGEEYSLVCPSRFVPEHCVQQEDGWRLLRIAGVLDFSLTGVLHAVTSGLAREKISVFAVSTFDTDYLLVREAQLSAAISVWKRDGYFVTPHTQQ